MSQRKLVAFLLLFVSAGIAIATLWPFDFFPSNGANWIPNRNGVNFSHPGVLISASPLVPPSNTNNSVTIELWLRSDEIWSSRTILGFYNPSNSIRLVVRQWNAGLFISRVSLANRNRGTAKEIYTKHLFPRATPLFLAITSSPAGTKVYVNGMQKQFFPNFQIRAGDLSGQIVLGTAPGSFSPWRGEIYLLSLYASAFSPEEVRHRYESLSTPSTASPGTVLAQYSFSESTGHITRSSIPSAPDLQIPKRFFVPYKPILQSAVASYESTWAYYRDAIVNIFGFIPFGFLLFAYLANTRLARFAVLYSFLSGAAFSFLLELLQGFIPQRDSGFNDVITNSLGTLLGAILAVLFVRRIPVANRLEPLATFLPLR